MMMGAVVKRYWAARMGLKAEDICLVNESEAQLRGSARGPLTADPRSVPVRDAVLPT